jgi:hypothetical protein
LNPNPRRNEEPMKTTTNMNKRIAQECEAEFGVPAAATVAILDELRKLREDEEQIAFHDSEHERASADMRRRRARIEDLERLRDRAGHQLDLFGEER